MACTLEDQLYYTSKFKSAILSNENGYILMVANINNLVEFPHYPNFGYIIYNCRNYMVDSLHPALH